MVLFIPVAPAQTFPFPSSTSSRHGGGCVGLFHLHLFVFMGKKKLNIAIFHCGFIYSGGGERVVLEEAKELIRRGHKVRVCAPTLDEEKCFPELIRELEVKTFFPTLVDRLPFRNAFRMIAASLLAPFLAYNFRDIDVFVGANQPGAWIAYCMARVLGRPVVVYLNQPNRVLYPRPVDKEYGWATTVRDYQFLFRLFQFIKPVIYWPDKLSTLGADKLLADGSYICGVIENVYGREAEDAPAGTYVYPRQKLLLDLHNGLYLGSVKVAGQDVQKPYVLVTNRHDPQKWFDYVIEAMRHVLGEYPNASLVITGSFTEHTRVLVEFAKSLGVEEQVLLLGQVTEG